MHDLRGNFFLNGKRRRGKERRIGEGKHRNEEGRGGKSHRETEGQEQERRTHRDKERQKENKEAPQGEHT